jgi:hypothetical protein
MHLTAGSANRTYVAEDEDEEVHVQGSSNWNFCVCSINDLLCGLYKIIIASNS